MSRPKIYQLFEGSENWLELQGVSFLREEDRDKPLTDFQALLASAQEGMLYVVCDDVFVEFAGEIYSTLDVRFFLSSASAPDFFSPSHCTDPMKLRPEILDEFPDYVVTSSGYAKVYVAHSFPAYLPEGFIYSTFGIAKEIVIKWKKVSPQKVISMVESSVTRKSKMGGVTDSADIQNLTELGNRLKEGLDIFSFYLFFVVHSPSKSELIEKGKKLTEILKSYGVEVSSPSFYQRELYMFRDRLSFLGMSMFSLRKIIADAGSMKALFPLIRETLVDDGGVFLGFSGTGDPIVVNPYRRQNYLMLILGETGSGKSMTAKVYLSRLHAKTKIEVFGVDPENEYIGFAHVFGAKGVKVEEGEKLGLDPLAIDVDRLVVADILSELYAIPQQLRPRLRKELHNFHGRSLFEFVNSCSHELRSYLDPITAPPDSQIFEGKPPELSGAAIFGLRGLRSEHLKLLVTSFVSAYLSQKLVKPSVLFVDEGWLYLKAPRIMGVFENVARRGRKYGLHFVFITQRVEDVASTSEGRTLLEQAATAVLLKQEREGADAIRDIYKLSDAEVLTLVNASPGEGLLKTGNAKISLRVAVTAEEMKKFSTTPAVSL